MIWSAMTREEVLSYAPAEAKTPLELALLGMVEDSAKEAQELREQVNDWELIGDESASLRQDLEDFQSRILEILENDDTQEEQLAAISKAVA
jgi:D-Tyr-tRNAtyr deacylase